MFSETGRAGPRLGRTDLRLAERCRHDGVQAAKLFIELGGNFLGEVRKNKYISYIYTEVCIDLYMYKSIDLLYIYLLYIYTRMYVDL